VQLYRTPYYKDALMRSFTSCEAAVPNMREAINNLELGAIFFARPKYQCNGSQMSVLLTNEVATLDQTTTMAFS
jgi:hypothetical protein